MTTSVGTWPSAKLGFRERLGCANCVARVGETETKGGVVVCESGGGGH